MATIRRTRRKGGEESGGRLRLGKGGGLKEGRGGEVKERCDGNGRNGRKTR